MRLIRSVLAILRGIDPFYWEIGSDNVEFYQHGFEALLQLEDDSVVDDEEIGQLLSALHRNHDLKPRYLQVMLQQWLIADPVDREVHREHWAEAMWRRRLSCTIDGQSAYELLCRS